MSSSSGLGDVGLGCILLVSDEMRFVLFNPSFPLWRNVIGIAAGVFIVPIVIILKLVLMPFERPAKRSAGKVAGYLRDFINETGGEWDFDDFISCEIEDPVLDSLRQRATELQLPIEDKELDLWKNLLREAEALAASEEVDGSH